MLRVAKKAFARYWRSPRGRAISLIIVLSLAAVSCRIDGPPQPSRASGGPRSQLAFERDRVATISGPD
jgi:hypothetical protein